MTIYVLGILSPGPNFFIISGTSLSRGRRQGIIVNFGVSLGLAIIFLTCVLGTKLIFAYEGLKNIMYIVCGLYMTYLALKIAYSLFKDWLDERNLPANASSGQGTVSISTGKKQPPLPITDSKLFKRGLITCLLNPGVYIFYSALYSKIALHYNNDFKISLGYAALFLAIEIIYFCGIAVLFSSLAGFFKQYSKYINAALCLILAFTGVDMIIKGIIGN